MAILFKKCVVMSEYGCNLLLGSFLHHWGSLPHKMRLQMKLDWICLIVGRSGHHSTWVTKRSFYEKAEGRLLSLHDRSALGRHVLRRMWTIVLAAVDLFAWNCTKNVSCHDMLRNRRCRRGSTKSFHIPSTTSAESVWPAKFQTSAMRNGWSNTCEDVPTVSTTVGVCRDICC